MRKLMKRTLVAVAAVSAVAAFTPAHAYVMASSMLNMTNFRILGSDGLILDRNTDFLVVNGTPALTFTGTADTSVALTGYVPQSFSATNPPTNPINSPPLCVGGACAVFADNALPKLTAPPTPLNYSAADQYESGAPIAGLPGFSDPANVGNAAYVGIDTGTATGSGDANNNLNSSFTFALGNDQTTGITFDFDLDAFLQVAVTADEVFPGFATASASMSFSITDLSTGNVIFNFNPDIFGTNVFTRSLNAPLPVNIQLISDTGGPKAFSATTGALTGGTLYQASFRMTTEADAGRLQQVPEPATLSLVGMGLLAAAGLGARRRAKAA